MKKLTLLAILLLIATTCFAESFSTGSAIKYFPKGATMVANKNGDSSSCFVTKIAKSPGYPEGTYELQLTSADWVGATVFPVTFTYILKEGDTLNLAYQISIYLSTEDVTFTVKRITDNYIELEEE